MRVFPIYERSKLAHPTPDVLPACKILIQPCATSRRAPRPAHPPPATAAQAFSARAALECLRHGGGGDGEGGRVSAQSVVMQAYFF